MYYIILFCFFVVHWAFSCLIRHIASLLLNSSIYYICKWEIVECISSDVCQLIRQPYYYRPQTKFGKVMFLHVSVSHSVHRGACMVARGCAWLQGGMCGCMGGMHGCGGHAWLLVGYVWLLGGVHGCWGEHAWLLWRHVWLLGGVCGCGGGCAWDMTRYGQWAGGTHPTGMHSCWKKYSLTGTKTRNGAWNVQKYKAISSSED